MMLMISKLATFDFVMEFSFKLPNIHRSLAAALLTKQISDLSQCLNVNVVNLDLTYVSLQRVF